MLRVKTQVPLDLGNQEIDPERFVFKGLHEPPRLLYWYANTGAESDAEYSEWNWRRDCVCCLCARIAYIKEGKRKPPFAEDEEACECPFRVHPYNRRALGLLVRGLALTW